MSRGGLLPAAGVLVLILLGLSAGLFPLAMPMGLAAGGVLETGQVAATRWWLGATAALSVYLVASCRMNLRLRLWWLAVLAFGLVSAVMVFGHWASRGQPHAAREADAEQGRTPRVGMVTALPLFWREGITPGEAVWGGARASPLVGLLAARPVDEISGETLAAVDELIVAQPRLLHPEELVALDQWIRAGGRVSIFADPLLLWPSRLPLGDRRRPPVTSLLDPLLAHWGLRLERVNAGEEGLQRRMLSTGHVLILAGASRFTLVNGGDGSVCGLREQGLIAMCRVGRGAARLVADADLLDDRLWLAHPQWSERTEAYASDIVSLLRARPSQGDPLPHTAPPSRVTDDEALLAGLRWAVVAAMLWVALGWAVQKRLFPSRVRAVAAAGEDR